MKKEDLAKYFPIAIIIILIFLSFLIIKSFILPIVSAFILAYLVKPVYDKLKTFLTERSSAIICTILIILIIIVPFAGLFGGIITQTYSSLNAIPLNNYLEKASNLQILKNLNIEVSSIISSLLEFLAKMLTNMTTHLPAMLIAIIVTIFGIYYLLLDWDKTTKILIKYLPSKNKDKLSKEISKITMNLVYGTLLIALIEFIIAMVGFYIAGVQYYLLLPTIIALFAFIPGLGPTIVWVPTAIILFLQDNIYATIIVVITGGIMSMYIDTIIRAKVAGNGTNAHPLILLIGILGGITVFGIFGFIIGPLILSYTIKTIEEIAEEMK